MQEWLELASALRRLNPQKFETMLQALREIVATEVLIAGADLTHLLEVFGQPFSA